MTRSASPFARALVAPVVFLLPLALGACGAGSSRLPTMTDPAAGDADFHDGSRLTFPLWRTADGFTVRKGTVHDGLFDVACAFEPASATGELRCLPVSQSFGYDRFADAACSQPLASDSLDDRYARFARYSDRCPDSYWIEIREAGAVVEATTVYERAGTEGCVAIARSARESYRYTGAVIPADRFVAAQEVVVQPTGRARLGAVRLVAEDGAWLQQPMFHDTRDDVRCRPQLASDGRYRCLPAGRYAVGIGDRREPDCSGPQIASPVGCALGAADVVEVRSSSCPRHVALHAPGAYWDGSRFWFDASGVCVAASTKGSSIEVGAELNPAQYALLELQQLGTGRLRTPVYVDVDVHAGHTVRASGTSPYDTLVGGPCTFTTDDAGATRCQPHLLTTAFRDARCSDPAAVDMYTSLTDPCFATGDPAPRYATMGGALYGPATRAPQRFDQLFTLVGPNASCQDATSSLTEPWVTHYTMGPRASFDLVAASP
jgi:hypothetical protein